MEKKVVMTASWSESEAIFKNLTKGATKSATNFSELIFRCPLPFERLYDVLEKGCLSKYVNDVTTLVTVAEDDVLFDCSSGSAIDIICRHLRTRNNGGDVSGHWCFLDTDRKAVVHFILKRGWYAEVYFVSDEESSALHITENEYGKNIIAVNFKKCISNEIKKASLSGGICLQEYLPRITGDILGRSRGGGQKKDNSSKENKTKHNTEQHPKKEGRDKWDGL